ncbi:hypothetical protein QO002_004471 [Pararhizobium capsulatum DSM 1112]|uniref:Uncharacterized protein n=1 Tax=Pararhizobium capsulatum DSM 1112 TaxID=1121113 RepID=A0ABU0BXW3_9HYPH|nr:hypothetical protein [Pararhizobium capsulatum DSM 1112]
MPRPVHVVEFRLTPTTYLEKPEFLTAELYKFNGLSIRFFPRSRFFTVSNWLRDGWEMLPPSLTKRSVWDTRPTA